ncbi:hypothetical protein STVA_41370 [Allostella vacuolata]|nr:hypothetical protein STVA_41370 [Stella vacuolata]
MASVAFDAAGSFDWVVPAGVTEILVKCWGAGGGGSDGYLVPVYGGGAGYVEALLSVTPGETLRGTVGGGGQGGYLFGSGLRLGGESEISPGGNGGTQSGLVFGSGGGGASGLRRGSTRLIVAPGGGGAGADPLNAGTGRGGVGGGTTGGNGTGSADGKGGTPSAGGSVGGSVTAGGNATTVGGGSALVPAGGSTESGSGREAGNNDDVDYADLAGRGGLGSGSSPAPGNPGRLVILYEDPSTPYEETIAGAADVDAEGAAAALLAGVLLTAQAGAAEAAGGAAAVLAGSGQLLSAAAAAAVEAEGGAAAVMAGVAPAVAAAAEVEIEGAVAAVLAGTGSVLTAGDGAAELAGGAVDLVVGSGVVLEVAGPAEVELWGGLVDLLAGGAEMVAEAAETLIEGAIAVLLAGQMLVAAGAADIEAAGGQAALLAGSGAVLTVAAAADAAAEGGAASLLAGVTPTIAAADVESAGSAAAVLAGTGAVLAAEGAAVEAEGGAADLVAGTGALIEAAAAADLVAEGAAPTVSAGAGMLAEVAAAETEAAGGVADLRTGAGVVVDAAAAEVALEGGVATVATAEALVASAAEVALEGGQVTLTVGDGAVLTVATGAEVTLEGSPATIVAGAPLRRPVPPPGDLDALLAPAAGAIEWALVIDAWDAEAGAVVPLRWSAGDYTTRPGDSLPSTRLPGRLADLQLRRALWAATELFGRSEPARGVAVVENADGALDPLATAATGSGARRWHFRWRRAQVLVGHPAWGWDDFRPVFTGLVEDATFDGGRASFQLRDRLRRLDRPVQQQVFGGDRVLLASASSVTVGAGSRSFTLPDLATNGSFAGSLAGWSAGAGWTHASGAAAKAAGTASALEQDAATAAGQAYRLRAVVTRSAGSLQVTLDGEPLGEPVAASATLRPGFVAAGATSRIGFLADAAFVGTVDGVTLRQEPDAVADDPVRIARTGDLAGTWMAGRVTSWTEALGELVVDVAEAAGAGTHADWSIWLRPYAGPAELAAKNLPVALGSVRHVAPPALDSVQGLWLYRLSDAPVRVDPAAGHGVFDGGAALDRAESFPPGPGEAFVDGAEGALWVASRPQYPLTVSMEAGLGATAGERVFAVPGLYTFQVPPGITALRARLWGAGGGHGGAGGRPASRWGWRLRRRGAGGHPGRGAAGGGAGRWRGRRGWRRRRGGRCLAWPVAGRRRRAGCRVCRRRRRRCGRHPARPGPGPGGAGRRWRLRRGGGRPRRRRGGCGRRRRRVAPWRRRRQPGRRRRRGRPVGRGRWRRRAGGPGRRRRQRQQLGRRRWRWRALRGRRRRGRVDRRGRRRRRGAGGRRLDRGRQRHGAGRRRRSRLCPRRRGRRRHGRERRRGRAADLEPVRQGRGHHALQRRPYLRVPVRVGEQHARRHGALDAGPRVRQVACPAHPARPGQHHLVPDGVRHRGS